MKLGIITALHGRSLLSALWAAHTSQFGLPVFAAITQGDTANVATAQRFGFTFVEMPNDPVGSKFQAALDMAMESDCDAFMVLPSDDFVSDDWVLTSASAIEAGALYLIPARIAVHCATQGTYELRSDGRSCGRYGAGRVISREVISACGGALWPGCRNKSLDSESHGRILAAGFTCTAVRTKLIPLVDVKTPEGNIWPWRVWRGGGHRCSAEEALHMLTPEQVQRISTLV